MKAFFNEWFILCDALDYFNYEDDNLFFLKLSLFPIFSVQYFSKWFRGLFK